MIHKIITGGQTGADQGALNAAAYLLIPTGGYVPAGWRTDDGPAPWLADFNCVEHGSRQYAPRTIANVRAADAVLWVGDPLSPGGRLTLETARREIIPTCVIPYPTTIGMTDVVRTFLRHPDGTERTIRTLLVAGNRESRAPGIGAYVERLLREVLRDGDDDH